MTNRWHIVNSKPGYLLPPIQAETKGERDSSIHKNASKLNRFTVCNWNSETYLDVSMVRKREITTYSNKSELNLENSIHDIHLQDGTLRKPVRQVQKKSLTRSPFVHVALLLWVHVLAQCITGDLIPCLLCSKISWITSLVKKLNHVHVDSFVFWELQRSVSIDWSRSEPAVRRQQQEVARGRTNTGRTLVLYSIVTAWWWKEQRISDSSAPAQPKCAVTWVTSTQPGTSPTLGGTTLTSWRPSGGSCITTAICTRIIDISCIYFHIRTLTALCNIYCSIYPILCTHVQNLCTWYTAHHVCYS